MKSSPSNPKDMQQESNGFLPPISGKSESDEHHQLFNHNQQQLSRDAELEQSEQSESEEVEAAIKTMKFREKRGTNIKELIKGNVRSDHFWDKHAAIFGGDLNQKESEDEQDYEESSSGRDQFDSDFNNTDSYPGKRGRKKGTRLSRRRVALRGKGRSKVNKSEVEVGERGRLGKEQKKEESGKRYKLIYKKMQIHRNDFFVIMKAIKVPKRGRKPKDYCPSDSRVNCSAAGTD